MLLLLLLYILQKYKRAVSAAVVYIHDDDRCIYGDVCGPLTSPRRRRK